MMHMLHKPKKQIPITAAGLQESSEVAIFAFKGLISSLKNVNEDAEKQKAENEVRIAELQAENNAFAELSKKNAKIIKNIENLFEA